MDYYELLKIKAAELESKIFLRADDKIFTYADFFNIVNQFNINRQHNERILKIKSSSFIEQAIVFFAAQKNEICPIILHGETEIDEINPPENNDILGVMTSGSTGKPKVLYRTYESWANFFPIQNQVFNVDRQSVIFIHGSLSFTGNLNVFLSILYAGGTVVTSNKFNCAHWLKLIDKCAVTTIYLVPTKLQLITKFNVENRNVKMIFTGSQVLTESINKLLMKSFPAAQLILYYGATELNYITYKIVNTNNISDVNNLGKAFKNVEVTIKDELIYVNNDYHVSGLAMPYTVGDVGHFDNDGNLIFEGRGADFINKGGYKISTLNVESKIRQIEGVADVSALKVKDEQRGENYYVFIVKDERAEKLNINKKIRAQLKPVEQPEQIIYIDELPLNDRGKVDRQKLFCEYIK